MASAAEDAVREVDVASPHLFEACVLGPCSRGHGSDRALVTARGALTYGELATGAFGIAERLRANGARMDDRVMLVSHDELAFVAGFFGIIAAGCTAIVCASTSPAHELARRAVSANARLAVVDASVGPDALPGCRLLRVGERDTATVPSPNASGLAPLPLENAEYAYCVFTSGTSGEPKGIARRHVEILFAASAYAAGVLQLRASDRVVTAVPVTSGYGLGTGLIFGLRAGATVELVHAATRRAVAKAAAQATVLIAHPRAIAEIVGAWEAAPPPDILLRAAITAGEALPAQLVQRWQRQTACPLLDGYGTTEVGAIFVSNRPGDPQDGALGRPLPGFEVEIRPEHDAAPLDGDGVLWVRGPFAFSPYWCTSDTARIDADGWCRTGDVFSTTAGRLRYHGRADDLLKVNCGGWLAPQTIESAVLADPAVAECAVTSALDQDGSMRLRAIVVVEPGRTATRELASAVAARAEAAQLTGDAVPVTVEFVSALPRNAGGKLVRAALRPHAITTFAPDC